MISWTYSFWNTKIPKLEILPTVGLMGLQYQGGYLVLLGIGANLVDCKYCT